MPHTFRCPFPRRLLWGAGAGFASPWSVAPGLPGENPGPDNIDLDRPVPLYRDLAERTIAAVSAEFLAGTN